MKAGIAFALPVVFAYEDVMVDEGLSLLQMRAQRHVKAADATDPSCFQVGDGLGMDGEVKLGAVNSKQECLDLVTSQPADMGCTGATMPPAGTGDCYCEKGWAGASGTGWITCGNLVADEDRAAVEDPADAPVAAEAQGPKYYLGARGSSCPPEEDIDYAQCLEAQVDDIIPHTMKKELGNFVNNQRSGGRLQRGCFLNIDGTMYFSDEPVGGTLGQSGNIQPICQKGGGGYEAYIAISGISCKSADCGHRPATEHRLNWGDGVVVPELQILAAGEVCEACGILSYAQCSKAGDTGLIEALYGTAITVEPSVWCSGGSAAQPIVPTGCNVQNAPHTYIASYCPFDTPEGIPLGLVSTSGVGVGFRNSRPVCGICKTTTTTNTTVDEASASGDPHLNTASGHKFDLSKADLNHRRR